MTSQHLTRIFELNRWANRMIVEACLGLSDEQLATSVAGTYGALGPTLAHIASGEASYAWRFDQNVKRFRWDEDGPLPSVGEIGNVLEVTGARLIELAASIADDHIVTYFIEDEQKQWPAWVVLGQAVDHGREHRSHIATILTQLGIEPPDIDMWSYGLAVEAADQD